MQPSLDIIKGLHPGFFLERELQKRKLKKGRFAMSIGEYPQTFSTILKGKRDMNVPLSLKIENALGFAEGYLMMLQLYYDIKEVKRKQSEYNKPDLSKLRPVLFWDTLIDKIDWQKHKRAVIERVFERGEEGEKAEIIRFYGQEEVDRILNNAARV